MADRLAEIEAASTQGHHEWWDRSHAMRDLRDLLAVAKAARAAEESLSRLIDYPHNCVVYPKCRDGDGVCATCYGMMVGDVLRAALANLEGGAT